MTKRLSPGVRPLIVLLCSLLSLAWAPFTGSAGAAPALSREITLAPSQLRFQETDGVTRVTLEGGLNALPAGMPDLPLVSVTVPLPSGTRAASVRVVGLETTPVPGRYRVAAAGAAGAAAGVSGAWSPADLLVRSGSGTMRGHALTGVLVAPVRWRADTGELEMVTRFRVEVTPEADTRAGGLTLRRESRTGALSFGGALAAMTGQNPADLQGAAALPLTGGGAFSPTFRPSVDGSPVDMVIVTDESQEAEYQRLADYRTRTGITTVVRTMSWVRANYPQGVDDAETLRNFIKDAVSSWGTAWVLLGGDTGVIPVRYVQSPFTAEETPTDIYYCDLDGTWNADGDSNFGELPYNGNPGDDLDLYPDVWIGRLPSTDAATAKTVVDKTLNYCESPPLGYQTDVLLLGEVLFPSEWSPGGSVNADGASHCESVADSLSPAMRPVKLYENYTAYPGALPETKAAAVDSINRGYGIVHHVGHGYVNTMSMGLGGLTLSNADAEALHNGDATFLLYAFNCTSSAIDFNCIAERFLLNDQGGAVASIGSSRGNSPATTRYYQDEFYSLMFHQGIRGLGREVALSRVPFVPFASSYGTHYSTQMEMVYLGDPSLELWTGIPDPLVVTHAGSFTLGQGTFSVSVTRSGSPEEGASVTLFKDGDAYAVGLTDASGQTVLPFTPDATGTFSVGVTAADALPYLGQAEVVASGASPHLHAVSQGVNDDTGGASDGNGNGYIDAGETIELTLTVHNSGGADAVSASASIASADPYLSFADPVSSLGTIPAGAQQAALDPMVFTVSANTPDRHEARCTVTFTGPFGSSQQEIILYLHAPAYEIQVLARRDTVGNGNGDGIISPNEDFALVPTLANRGFGDGRNVGLHLRSTDPGVTVSDSLISVGALASGAVITSDGDAFTVRLADTSSVHALTLTVTDAYGEAYRRNIDLTRPAAVTGPSAVGDADAIELRWNPNAEADLWGYNIYRASTAAGPFVRVNEGPSVRTAYFKNEQLPGLTQYVYRIAAVDSSGNEGPYSPLVSATTSLPMHTGWPVETSVVTTGGVTMDDLDRDGKLEIVAGGEEIYVLTPSGGDFLDGDASSSTLGPFTDTGGTMFWCTPAVGDVDGDTYPDVVAPGWTDKKLHVYDHLGQELPGWPQGINPNNAGDLNPIGSPAIGDLDGDGTAEIVLTAGKTIFAFHGDGTELRDGDANPATVGVLATTGAYYSYGSPSIADLDGDGQKEIVAGMRDGKLYVFHSDGTPYAGFPFVTAGDITTGPAIGDLDGDGQKEIVFGSSAAAKVYAIHADKSSSPGFPVNIQLTEDFDSSPALADINEDGKLDVVIGGSTGGLFVFSGADGSVLSGFPALLLDAVGTPVGTRSSPAVADVDGDGHLDIVIGDKAGRLQGFDRFGQRLLGFPIQTGNRIESSPMIWDMDSDGLTEVLVKSNDQKIYCWDTPWTFNHALAAWPMYKHDARHTSDPGSGVLEVTGVPGGRPEPVRLRLANAPNPFRAATVIRYAVPEASGFRRVRLEIFDLSGRLIRTLVDGEQPAGSYELRWDGRDRSGAPAAAGIYPYRLRVDDRAVSRKLVLLR